VKKVEEKGRSSGKKRWLSDENSQFIWDADRGVGEKGRMPLRTAEGEKGIRTFTGSGGEPTQTQKERWESWYRKQESAKESGGQ